MNGTGLLYSAPSGAGSSTFECDAIFIFLGGLLLTHSTGYNGISPNQLKDTLSCRLKSCKINYS